MPALTGSTGPTYKTSIRDQATRTLDHVKRRVVFPLVARLYRAEPPNATIYLTNGARIRAFLSGHGTDVADGEGETFYVAADERQFDVWTGYARESTVSDSEIARIETDDG